MLNEQDLIGFLDGSLPPNERSRVEAELEQEPQARRQFVQQLQMERALRVSLGTTAANENVKQSVLAVIRGDSEENLKQQVLEDTTFVARRKERLSPTFSLFDLFRRPAWIVLFLCVLSAGWFFTRRNVEQPITVAVAIEMPTQVSFSKGTTVLPGSNAKIQQDGSFGSFTPQPGDGLRVGNIGSSTVTFADGTILQLDVGTEIRFDSISAAKRTGGKQLRLISGSLSANVAKQPKDLPLLIETPHALVTVVGTEFDLAVETNETQLEVTHGLVELSGASTPEKLKIGSGEIATASPDGPPLRLARNPYLWPFSSESPWNMPIGSGAKYEPIPGRPFLADGPLTDPSQNRHPLIGNPNDPLRNFWVDGQLRGDLHLSERALPQRLRDSAVFLQRMRRYALELRDVSVQPNGDLTATGGERTDLAGAGIIAQAVPAVPFGLSNLGGLIRTGEYENGIRHALSARVKRERLSGRRNFAEPGTVWPATGGDNPIEGFLNVGTLLAIPPDVDIVAVVGESGPGYELARAMQDYGVYVTGFARAPFTLVVGESELPSEKENELLNQLVPLLQVVINNTEQTPGGGGNPRCPLAPSLPAGQK